MEVYFGCRIDCEVQFGGAAACGNFVETIPPHREHNRTVWTPSSTQHFAGRGDLADNERGSAARGKTTDVAISYKRYRLAVRRPEEYGIDGCQTLSRLRNGSEIARLECLEWSNI